MRGYRRGGPLLLVKIAGAGDTRWRRCGSLTGIASVSADATIPDLQEEPAEALAARREEEMKQGIRVSKLATLMLFAALAPASAQVCGDTLGPNGTFTLNADIGPCDGAGTAALTIVGPVKVDLNGHQVSCSALDPSDGIDVQGSAASVTGGSIRGCDAYSMRVGGTGKHSIHSITIKGGSDAGDGFVVVGGATSNRISGIVVTNGGVGFRLGGDKDRLSSLVATNMDDEGFIITGNGSRIDGLVSTNATKEGLVISGSSNRIDRCESISSGNAGIEITGDGNRLRDCRSVLSTGQGFTVTGASNSIVGSDATNNGQRGFDLAGTGTKLSDSSSVSNTGDGVLVSTGSQVVSAVRAANNGGNGIQVSGGTGSAITGSVVLENGGATDVRDTTSCAGATWTDNVFGTSNDACIE
jgi:hypothetical protein